MPLELRYESKRPAKARIGITAKRVKKGRSPKAVAATRRKAPIQAASPIWDMGIEDPVRPHRHFLLIPGCAASPARIKASAINRRPIPLEVPVLMVLYPDGQSQGVDQRGRRLTMTPCFQEGPRRSLARTSIRVRSLLPRWRCRVVAAGPGQA